MQLVLNYWTLKRQARNGLPLIRRLKTSTQSPKTVQQVPLTAGLQPKALLKMLLLFSRFYFLFNCDALPTYTVTGLVKYLCMRFCCGLCCVQDQQRLWDASRLNSLQLDAWPLSFLTWWYVQGHPREGFFSRHFVVFRSAINV